MVSGVRFQVSVENETPGPDRTIHESGKWDIIGNFGRDLQKTVKSHSPRHRRCEPEPRASWVLNPAWVEVESHQRWKKSNSWATPIQ